MFAFCLKCAAPPCLTHAAALQSSRLKTSGCSAHVLTEDVLYREVTPSNHLLSRRLLTKTNRLPGWAERVFPAHMARAVYVLEDSVVDPQSHTLTTKTWNLNHNALMTVVEQCSFEEDRSRPSWTKLRREAWILSAVYGLARPIQRRPLLISMATRESRQRSTSPSHRKPRPPPPRSPSSSSERPLTGIHRIGVVLAEGAGLQVNLSRDWPLCEVLRDQVRLLNVSWSSSSELQSFPGFKPSQQKFLSRDSFRFCYLRKGQRNLKFRF
ncbi:uncharacterized protein LOC122870234 isoform X2 [Siniperca chuatsi]|uniref:uncharacterized protein LOC122870234 isoform X2 n=1 Tax=Siniperca chuatsi TaxID=119488 RepID=UPI001CE05AC6|nr:uncharacterized protein LOC122870234 isoform X2 [Siniperca chuatsi]